jgi:hypothetical protein
LVKNKLNELKFSCPEQTLPEHPKKLPAPRAALPPVLGRWVSPAVLFSLDKSVLNKLHPDGHRVEASDENGRKNLISTSVSIFFGENGIGFGKCGFENETGICGCTETNQYGRKFNGNGRKSELKPEYHTSLYSQITITHKIVHK